MPWKNISFIFAKTDNIHSLISYLNFDACFIDGDHKNCTISDWEAVKHCGHVLFHEYWEHQKSVFDLVNSLPKNEVDLTYYNAGMPYAYWEKK